MNMRIAVFQIKEIKNVDYAFRGWTETTKKLFNFTDYKKVYESFNERDDKDDFAILDNAYAYFNDEACREDGFKGHSMSMSDIVAVGDRYYYCDMCGWEDITKFVVSK